MSSNEIILAEDSYKHKDRDYTWELCDYEIEDKIKELRKEIYHLQNCRKKQPKLLVFRKENFGEGEMKCHIFHGFQITNEKERLLCADYWRPITQQEYELVLKTYPNLKKEFIKIMEDTIKENKNA